MRASAPIDMPERYKPLILVMAAAIAVFVIGRPVFAQLMREEDFRRRRNLWLVLTAAFFLAPNIWVYALAAATVLLFAARTDPNPAAVYLFLLLVVPPLRVQIPTLGLIGQVFPIDHLRILSLALLLPVAIAMRRSESRLGGAIQLREESRLAMVDILLLCFLGLQVAVTLPYETVTSSLRRVVLLLIDVALPYFVLSRACRSREMIAEAMASFVMATVLLAPLAVFEFARGWMLYAGAQDEWNAGRMFYPLYRGGLMRAITTAGHSINLGYFMAIGFGMWLYLRNRLTSQAWGWLGFATLLTGLTVTLARGSWVGAAVIFAVYLAAGPKAAKRSIRGIATAGALFGIVLLSPWRAQIVDYLPFVGTIDADTIAMREKLAEGSWQLIQLNPFFGSPSYLAYMEQFRTGEGIIDLVNTYAGLALSFGLVGTALFLSIFVVLVWKTHSEVRATADADANSSLMGAALIACIAGTLVVIATTSFQLALPSVTWAIAGLTAAYVRLPARSPAMVEVQRVPIRAI